MGSTCVMPTIHRADVKHKVTGPGTITASGSTIEYWVDYDELIKFKEGGGGDPLAAGDDILVWVDTQYKGIRDRAPDTDGDPCAKPDELSETIERYC